MSRPILRCHTLVYHCVYPPPPRQESVYLSLQSNLVTLQVLSASPLLQEFIPHLLHLSNRVQTPSSLQPHTVWWQLLADTESRSWTEATNRRSAQSSQNAQQQKTYCPQRSSVNFQAEFSCLAAFHFFLSRLSYNLCKKKDKEIDSFHRENTGVCFQKIISSTVLAVKPDNTVNQAST